MISYHNSIYIITPYKHQGFWVFDDERVGLVQEPFVGGASALIYRVTQDISDAENGFTMLFSALPFPGHEYTLQHRRAGQGGDWYYSDQFELEAWLCPSLLEYFPKAPGQLFIQVKNREETG